MLSRVLKITFFVLCFYICFQVIYRTEFVSKGQCGYRTNRDDSDDIKNQNETAVESESLSKDECRDILPCLTNGSWSLKKDISKKDIEKRIQIDEFIYTYQGFPRTFIRSDGRCGRKFPPVPNLKKAGSVCDAYSTKPCCNEDEGRCGSTDKYCTCKNCTDFSQYLPAEIAKWNTWNEKCRMKEFNHVEACSFFSDHISEMLFVGDSLTRHIFTALALLLTNDTTKGALSIKKNVKRREQCQGELQFIDSGKFNCHVVIARKWQELPTVCGGKTNFEINLEQAYNLQSYPKAKNAVRRLLNKTGSVVVFNVGLHMGHDSKYVIGKYVGPIVDMVAQNGHGWPKMIWHNLHGIENFLRSDVNELFTVWKRFNVEMGQYMKSKGIVVLDSGQLTRGIKSYDALHFGLGGNMLKVQVLINYLEAWFKMCKKHEVGQ